MTGSTKPTTNQITHDGKILYEYIKGVLAAVIPVDAYDSVQDAFDAAAALGGLSHDPSSAAGHPTWIQPNTSCKLVDFKGKKYPISTTLNITGDVGIRGGNGGVYLADDFAPDASNLAVKCHKGTGNQYAGHISGFLIDVRAKVVDGFQISDGYANQINGLYVANINGNGIKIAGGMGVHLNMYYAVSTLKPNNPLSAGIIVEGSDHHVGDGESRYFRIGSWIRNGGNNRFHKMHNWGMYDDRVADQNSRMKMCFVIQNSINNTFVQCFADSPSKWDYTKDNLAPVDGYINGGIGFFIDANSEGNSFIGCQTFVNMYAYNAADLSGYTASLMPFAVGSINCTFMDCSNSNSPAWTAKLINHIYSISDTYTTAIGNKNFVGIEYDNHANHAIFKRSIGAPLYYDVPKYDTVTTPTYAPNFSDAGYVSATITAAVAITPAAITSPLTGYLEVTLAVYSATSQAVSFGSNVTLAQNTPSLTASGTRIFRLSTNNGGTSWRCRQIASYS